MSRVQKNPSRYSKVDGAVPVDWSIFACLIFVSTIAIITITLITVATLITITIITMTTMITILFFS